MIKRFWPYARPYGLWMAAGVACSALEAVFELLIPLVMSDIVDIGIANGDVDFILRKGALMVGLAVVSMALGLGAAVLASVASQGFGAALRQAEYDHIQTFAFSNIERFSTASLVTRLTNDVNTLQMTLMMGMRLLIRAPVMLVSALISLLHHGSTIAAATFKQVDSSFANMLQGFLLFFVLAADFFIRFKIMIRGGKKWTK